MSFSLIKYVGNFNRVTQTRRKEKKKMKEQIFQQQQKIIHRINATFQKLVSLADTRNYNLK